MVVGMKYGYADPNDESEKAELYRLIQSLALRFREKNGSYICRDLLGLGEGADDPVPEARTDQYYQSRPCAGLVAYAADMLGELMDGYKNG